MVIKKETIWNLYEFIGLLSCSCAGYYVRRLTVLSLHVTHTVPLCRHPCPIPQLVTTRKNWPVYPYGLANIFASRKSVFHPWISFKFWPRRLTICTIHTIHRDLLMYSWVHESYDLHEEILYMSAGNNWPNCVFQNYWRRGLPSKWIVLLNSMSKWNHTLRFVSQFSQIKSSCLTYFKACFPFPSLTSHSCDVMINFPIGWFAAISFEK